MDLVHDTNYVTEALSLLTSAYVNQPNIVGIITALMTRAQQIEDDFWAMFQALQLSNHPMAGGPWDILDKLGALVGAPPRQGRSDADYLAIIRIAIRTHRSKGLSEDIIQIAALIVSGAVYFDTGTPGVWELDTYSTNASTVQALVYWLQQARLAGTSGVVTYSLHPKTQTFIFDSTAGPSVAEARGFADTGGSGQQNVISGVGVI